ncbi:MAG: hypothetical protein VX519_12495 [Myxococcota bacterium]|nr:hypothetical protein [Myxococcota bacterium]
MAKDLYRLLVWGPYRGLVVKLPAGMEFTAHRGLAAVATRVSGEQRRRVKKNLGRVFPADSDLDALVERCFRTHFEQQYLCFSFPRMNAENWPRYLDIQGREHLDASLAAGKGVVLMHPHMGPAQLPLCVLGILGYDVLQVAGSPSHEELSNRGRWASDLRHRLEGSMPVRIQDGTRYLRPVLRVLEQGGVVLTAMDGTGAKQEIGRRVDCELFGQPVSLPVGPVWFALRTGAALHTLATVSPGPGETVHRASIGPAITLDRSVPFAQGLEQGVERMVNELEALLSAHPGDWHFWDAFEPGRMIVETS